MATDLHQVKAAPAVNKYEAFVEAQLARARVRVRSLDLTAAALGLLILTLAYGLILALCDRWLELSPLARQTAFAVYAAGGLVYLGLLIVRPLCRQINPYYAARRLEQTIPEAKNSVVNWLDLHQQAIAPAFRSAIGHQAAKDLADADLEQAISARRTSWMGAGAAGLFVSLLVLFVLGPRQFLSLMNRAFAPFVEAPIATRTRLLLVRPEGGDVTIQVGRAVGFSVWVEGRVPEASSPEALKLLYRYNLSDPYQTRLLERGDSSREWLTNLLASEVHNGFWYRVAGGDAESPEYRVQVRSTPLFVGFDVTYHYRPYLGWPDRMTHDQNLQDLRGTEVTLLARTNRTVKDGQLVIERQKPIAAELVPEDPQALRFRLRLENDGSYHVWFRSVDGERNTDPMAYTIRVLQDQLPQVELTKPGEDSQLPPNGVLRLEGTASDDFGIASLSLRLKIENGATLQSKPYRKGEALCRGDGSYPQVLAYRDFVELDKLQREDDQPLEPLKPGANIEYWLEATDNCDYPGPNIGDSKHFKITIQAADANKKKQEQERQEARQEQQKHEKKQDQDLQNQKRESPDKPQEQNPRPPDADQPSKQGDKQNEEDLNKQKEQIENAIKEQEQQQKAGEKGESKGDKPQESKGEGKGDTSSERQVDKSQSKGTEEGQGKRQPGQEKGAGQPQTSPEKGEQKGEGQAAPGSDGDRGNKRGQQEGTEGRTKQGMTEGNKGESKGDNPQESKGEGKGDTSSERPVDKSQSKGTEEGQGKRQPGQEKGAGQPQTSPEKGEQKGEGQAAPGSDGDRGNKRGQQGTENPGEGQKKGSNQDEGKNSPEAKAAQTNPWQPAAGEKPDSKQEQKPGQGQRSRLGEGDKKPPSNQENGNQAGANKKPEAGAEKTEKKAPGQEGRNQEAGQPKSEPADKTVGSPGESKADKPATPEREAKAAGGQGDGAEAKATSKGNSNDARANAAKAQEKPAGADKGDAGNRAAAKPEKKENSSNPAARGAQGTDKVEDKGRVGSEPGRDDQMRAQPPKPERPGAAQAGEKSQDEVSALSEALKGGDEKARANARKKLEELRDRAQDQGVRRAAADALEHAGQDTASRPSQESEGTKPGTSNERSKVQAPSKSDNGPDQEAGKRSDQKTAAKKGNEEGTGQSDTAKGEPKKAKRTNAQGDSGSATAEQGGPATPSVKPGASGASGSRGGNEPTAKTPNPNGSSDNRPDREQDPMEPATAPNAAYQKQAGELQLEEIKKRINKDVLKQLNMTKEDFQKFVKAYEEMSKRKQQSGADKEKLAGPQRGNRSLPSQNVRLIDPREQGKGGNLQRLGPAAAPLEFRDAYKEFSRRISELEQAKEKN